MKLIIFYFDPAVTRMLVENNADEGNGISDISSPYNFVSTNEVVAKVIEVDNAEEAESHVDEGYTYYKIEQFIPLSAGEDIVFDESLFAYKATAYGFVWFDKNSSKISLRQPLLIPKGKVEANYIVHPTKLKRVATYADIIEVLTGEGIHSSLDKDQIEEQLNRIDVNKPVAHKINVASGKKPENGHTEYFIPMIEIEKKAGTKLDDGSIDFKEINAIIDVKKDQEVLRRIPAKDPVDGNNIYGDKVKGKLEKKKGYVLGQNIAQSKDNTIYVSLIDGCIEADNKRKISVLPVVNIQGDVDYETGNINFDGSVQIFGSVLPGFSIKAKGSVFIEKSVDDAIIETQGDLIVNLGIAGKGSTKIIAGGDVKAKFVLNSTIEANGIIEIQDSIINSNVYSNDKIIVTAKHGDILGGETVALHDIIIKTAGGPSSNMTTLTVGKSFIIEKELLKIKKQMDLLNSIVGKLVNNATTSFSDKLFKDPKKYIPTLPPVKQKNCLMLLSKVSEYNEERKKYTDQHEEIKGKLKLKRDPVIVVLNETHPGIIIKIMDSVKTVEEKLAHVKFYEDKHEKTIMFTSAE